MCCTGTTGHAEVCKSNLIPDVITVPRLVECISSQHPIRTTLKPQGADVVRSIVSDFLSIDDEQKGVAEEIIKELVTETLDQTNCYRSGEIRTRLCGWEISSGVLCQ